MKKYIIGSVLTLAIAAPIFLFAASPDPLALIAKIFGLQVQIMEQQTKILQQIAENTKSMQSQGPTLGGIASRNLRLSSSATASTSPTFFRADASDINNSASSTLLTVGCDATVTNKLNSSNTLQDVDTLGLYVQITATTSGNPTVNVQPQVSNDCIDWYGIAVADQVTTAGTLVQGMSISTATSSSFFTFAITQKPTSQIGMQEVTIKNLATKAIRFTVWTQTATSSIWLQTTEVVRNTYR